jgi:hypothetical protein
MAVCSLQPEKHPPPDPSFRLHASKIEDLRKEVAAAATTIYRLIFSKKEADSFVFDAFRHGGPPTVQTPRLSAPRLKI